MYDSLGLPRESFPFITDDSWNIPMALTQMQDQSTDVCGRWAVWFVVRQYMRDMQNFNPVKRSLKERVNIQPDHIDIDLFNGDPALLANDMNICKFIL